MIIAITPFIEDKASYRLANLRRDEGNARINLAEPQWYSNDHFDVFCLMYGGRAPKRPDIIDMQDLQSVEAYLDDQYGEFDLVHVPRDIHLEADAIHDIVRSRRYRDFPRLDGGRLDRAFIRAGGRYHEIPVSLADAADPASFPAGEPLVCFRESNDAAEINDCLHRPRPIDRGLDERVTAMPVGAWCGVAEALKSLGLRKEAYPFDYIRTDLSLIVDLLDIEHPTEAEVDRLLFDGDGDGRAEFVHHKSDDPKTRATFVTRTMRFIGRIRNSDRPLLFVRVTHANDPLEPEVRKCRDLLRVVDRTDPDRRNKLALISNFHDVATDRLATLDNGRIVVWNAMGAFGWKVPNNWHVINHIAKIIAHELHYFDSDHAVV